MAWPASTDPYFQLISTLAHAWATGYTNEFAFDQKAEANGVPTYDDPIKVRLGAWVPVDGRPNYYLATISFDQLVASDGKIKRLEKGFIGVKMDPYPVLELYLQRTPWTVEDGDMELVFRWSAANGLEFWTVDEAGERVPMLIINREQGVRFLLPVSGMTGGGGTPTHVDTMWAPTGLSFTQQQGDGNFVTYTTTVPFSKAPAHVKAVWSAWHGKIG